MAVNLTNLTHWDEDRDEDDTAPTKTQLTTNYQVTLPPG